jgi:protease IV
METSNNNQTTQTVIVKPKIGGFLWAYIIFSLPGFLVSILWVIVSVILMIALLAGIGATSQANAGQESLGLEVLKTGKSSDGVLVYDLAGAITSGNFSNSSTGLEINTTKVAKDFAKIKANPQIKNVVFRMNTPGGELYASEILGDLMADLQNSKVKTVPNIYFDQISASGGLWSSYKTKAYVIGSPYGETGSIGVIQAIPNYKGIADKIGYSQTIIKSSESKDIGNPFKDMTMDEKKFLQSQLDIYYNRFKSIVATGRNLDLNQVESLATGFVFSNAEAKQKGLLDEVGSIDTLIQKSAKEAGLSSDYSVYKVERKSNPFGSLLSGLEGSSLLNFFGSQNLPVPTKLQSGQVYLIDESRSF